MPNKLLNPLTAETLWKLRRLGPPALSPDGALAAVPVSSDDADSDETRTEIWLAATNGTGSRPFTTQSATGGRPAWSPDGRFIAFVAEREGDDAEQLYVVPVDGGEARRVTSIPTGASAPKWFPDSRRIAFISRVWTDLDDWAGQRNRLEERRNSRDSAMVWDRPMVRWWSHWLDDRDAHLFVTDIDGSEPRGITVSTGLRLYEFNFGDTTPGPDSYDIAPEGEEVAFAADVDESFVDPDFRIFLMPLEGGQPRDITGPGSAADESPSYSPDGRWLVHTRQLVKGFYADKLRLVRHDRESGTSIELAEDWDRSATGLVWSADGSRLYGSIDDAAHQRIYSIAISDGTVSPITGERSFTSLATAGDEPVLIGLRQSFTEPPTLVKIDPANGAQTRLTDFNDKLLADVDFGDYESVTFAGANGDEIQMWINYPPGFDRSRKWPLYLMLHGGPHNGIIDSFSARWNAQIFAGWGYVTAWHNFHGSSGFGQAFADSINPDVGDLPYRDTILASDYFARQEWIDEARMAAGGGSFGGYLAAILLGREHPFRTLVAHATVYNEYTQYAADYGAHKRRFGEHWEDEQFATWSPHIRAENFNTPTLVIHGEQDHRVPVNHGLELFNTLQNRGVQSRLIYFPDENHWVLKPGNSIFWYAQKHDWLNEFIGQGPSD
jgi:dipeptidyl aminopeptidase/acylaminoacyl peptidase